jgi:hypothetical protein
MPSNINQAGRPGTAIYTLPIGTLSRQAQLAADEGTREIYTAEATDQATEQAIDLRVDWNGDASHLGHFEVLVKPSTWQPCGRLDAYDTPTDMIKAPTSSTTFRARFQRGPVYNRCRFGVKAVPIVWKGAPLAQLDPSYVAQRGTDYEYEAGILPDLVAWTESVFVEGAHRLILLLSKTGQYEIWVRLQDPNDPNHWQIQDPIVVPVDPTPIPKTY